MIVKARWLLAAVLLAQPAQARQPVFSPETGFSGSSDGEGSLRLFLGSRRPFHVHSEGHRGRDGTFRLQQTVRFDGKPARTRVWTIRQVAPCRYAGTLSDAAGPVSGHADGPRLTLRYRIKGPLVMHQTLELQPDGRTIDNAGRITLLGIPVGAMHETIRRADEATTRPADATAGGGAPACAGGQGVSGIGGGIGRR